MRLDFKVFLFFSFLLSPSLVRICIFVSSGEKVADDEMKCNLSPAKKDSNHMHLLQNRHLVKSQSKKRYEMRNKRVKHTISITCIVLFFIIVLIITRGQRI